jgi:nucleotide-binding universal stress UspA family protein
MMSTPAQEQIMIDSTSPAPVVVAVDGSNAAINAAEWAAKEALHHDVALRLVHVIHITGEAPATANSIDDEYAETCLHAACSAVKALGIPVQVDTALLRGDTVSTLIEESDGATLICLGSTGIDRLAAAVLGSTTATVAERAHCPWRAFGAPRIHGLPKWASSPSSLTATPRRCGGRWRRPDSGMPQCSH